MRKFLAIGLFLCIFTACGLNFEGNSFKSKAVTVIDNKEALETALKLPRQGKLKMKRDGFIYLKVDDGYIYSLYPFLHDTRIKVPPYFRESDSPGAHISVVYTSESRRLPKTIPEINQTFTFTPLRLERIHKKNGTDYYILAVESKDLEAFRKNLGLQPKLNNHDFHITFAVKRPFHEHRHKRRHYRSAPSVREPIKILAPS